MAQNDVLKRYIDAGLAFTAMTQGRAEALVKELVKAGEVQADQAREAVADLVDRSRRSSEKLMDMVRTEVRSQITNLGLASQADLDRIEHRISSLLGTATAPAKRAATATTRKAPAKKAAATKSAKKSATKSARKAATARKAPAKTAAAAKKSAKKA